MLPKIIFCTAVSVATVAVILLAVISPTIHHRLQNKPGRQSLSLSLYIQNSPISTSTGHHSTTGADGALVFHHTLTEGPKNSSTIVGEAQGFIIPIEHFAHSVLNIIYVTVNIPGYSGSLSIQAQNMENKATEELKVVGGTGAFAFAKGLALFTHTDSQNPYIDAIYHLRIRLRFPHRSHISTPG